MRWHVNLRIKVISIMAIAPVPPMAATIAAALPVGELWTYEVKWDGYRAMLLKDGTTVRLISRNLKDLTADYPHIAVAANSLTGSNALVDGEIVALDERGVPSFQSLQHRTGQKSAVVYYAFDLLHLGTKDYRSRPLRERRQALSTLTFAPPILLSGVLPGTPSQIEEVVRAVGLEGVVAKRIDSAYEAGHRSRAWVKVKFSQRQEFVVGGYKPADDSFDSVLVGFYEGRRLLYAGKVRAGFTGRTRAEVFARIKGADMEKCPFVNLPNSDTRSHWGEGITAADMKTLRWVKPRVVLEVAFTEFTAGGNLRHAAYVSVRTDKAARDVRRGG